VGWVCSPSAHGGTVDPSVPACQRASVVCCAMCSVRQEARRLPLPAAHLPAEGILSTPHTPRPTFEIAPAAPDSQHVHVGRLGIAHQPPQLGIADRRLEHVRWHDVGACREGASGGTS